MPLTVALHILYLSAGLGLGLLLRLGAEVATDLQSAPRRRAAGR
jgi:hypothetical protein